ncbi:hypothetical protein [Sediminibacillus massiliensis]|uniref:hypothetical protein n=1 Tax=Sediminibacillus massiliensis TaxID=1926277 RepID=UPI0015C2EAC2|nr:hypothetical protein [Sediminibacillus massiliensis]
MKSKALLSILGIGALVMVVKEGRTYKRNLEKELRRQRNQLVDVVGKEVNGFTEEK